MSEKWTAERITAALVRRINSPCHYSKSTCILPNAHWGMGLAWEADLLCCSKARFLTEVEIKISRADFIADQHKWKHSGAVIAGRKFIKRFYYAMPQQIWDRCQDVWRAPGAGVIVVSQQQRFGGWDEIKVVVPAVMQKAERLSDDGLLKMHQLLSMRYWDKYAKEHSNREEIGNDDRESENASRQGNRQGSA